MTAEASFGMLPEPALLPDVLPTERLTAKGVAQPPVRAALRRIPNVRNGVTVGAALVQTFGVVIAAGVIGTWWSYLGAFVVMGRGHCQLNILGHEAAHRLLFSSRRLNDFCGRWLLSYPAIAGMLAYRRVHMAHHRDEMGPEEPDAGLYRGYPVPPDSLRRKLVRDLCFVSGYKNLRGLAHAARRSGRRSRRPVVGAGAPDHIAMSRQAKSHEGSEARQVVAVQLTLFGLGVAAGRPLLYPLCWLAPWMSLWKVSNRLRAIAEHGGMARSDDRRETTHVIRQRPLARLILVPYNTGWHLAHHVDIGVPFRHLPRFHEELVASGWIVPDLEYPSYTALWRKLGSGPPRGRLDRDERDAVAGSSFLPT